MSEYSSLYVGNYRITEWPNGIDGEIASLFTEDDFTDVPHAKWHENWIYANGDERLKSLPCFQYKIDAGSLMDRLELLGYSIDSARQLWNKRKEHLESILEIQDEEWKALHHQFSYDTWLDLLGQILNKRLKPIYGSKHQRRARALLKENPYLHFMLIQVVGTSFLFGYPDSNLSSILRSVCEKVRPETPVVLDCSTLVNWVEPSQYTVDELPQIVVLTEGSSDKRIIEQTLHFLYPHLYRYFKFIDFDTTHMPGSAGHLVNIVKAFVATGTLCRTIALFDNDAAGLDAIRQLNNIRLPDTIKVITLPHLDIATQYPTIGPHGNTNVDINGAACSLELYLGEDILRENGQLIPIRNKGFIPSVQRCQGEIISKRKVQDRYFDLLKRITCEPKLAKNHDWTGMQLVLRSIFTAFKSQPLLLPEIK